MLKIGQINKLHINKQVSFGMYLDGGAFGEILLPRRYVPEGFDAGDDLEVFIYLDSEDRLIATTEMPKVEAGQCALLEVVDISKAGAFLDWGLPKDLLVPFSEQETRMAVGELHVVHVHYDERTQNIVGSTRLAKYLSELGHYYKAGQKVDLQIYGRSDLGYKAVINDTHLGQLYENETFQGLEPGQKVQGYIKKIRSDMKIDLSLQEPGSSHVITDDLIARIVEHLRARGGSSEFTDKTAPDLIYDEFQVSKAQFKRAIGKLYKQKIVKLEPGRTILL